MALAARSISRPCGDLDKASAALPIVDLTERERERELDKYAGPRPRVLTNACPFSL